NLMIATRLQKIGPRFITEPRTTRSARGEQVQQPHRVFVALRGFVKNRHHSSPSSREKQLRAPVWHTLPSPSRRTFRSTVSSPQSTRIWTTARRFPDVSPLVHSVLRVRLKKVA